MVNNKRSEVTTACLSNGMPAVFVRCPRSAVEICGVCVKAGSRNELPTEYGLAHFVEHTLFKGTKKRRSSHIINRMEAVGGELNAYTTKEETVVYSVFPYGNLSRATELIGDLCANSTFPESELEKEREVVADEIDSYLDTPSEAIYDDFEDLIFAGSPLGHNILGYKDSLTRFDSKVCGDFVRRNYRADNMVAFYSGPRSALSALRIIDRNFSVIEKGTASGSVYAAPPVADKFDITRSMPSHQAHCVIGARVGSYLSPERFATALLVNIMGGPGMNSFLNVELRERRGLVYSVDATTALFSDCGMMTVYFGCDPADVMRCREIVARTFINLKDKLTASRLEAAKKQYLGQLVLASENRENSVLASARSLLWRGDISTPSATEQKIKGLTVDDVLNVAKPMLSPSLLTFSPQ